jgi:hypothetical protein
MHLHGAERRTARTDASACDEMHVRGASWARRAPVRRAMSFPRRARRTNMTPGTSAITHLIAGVPVSDLDAGVDWYTRFFDRAPDLRVGDEILWDIEEHATLFIEPNAAHAGTGRITFAVAGLDAIVERLAADGIGHEPPEAAL